MNNRVRASEETDGFKPKFVSLQSQNKVKKTIKDQIIMNN